MQYCYYNPTNMCYYLHLYYTSNMAGVLCEAGTAYSSRAIGFTSVFLVGFVLLIFLAFCLVFFCFVCFHPVSCPMLPMSVPLGSIPDYPFWFFSSVYFNSMLNIVINLQNKTYYQNLK